MAPELVQITVNGTTLKWYRSRGYEVPTRPVQLWATIDGRRVKNGVKHRVSRGTVISVATLDLMPGSNEVLTFSCEACARDFTTTWQAHRLKISNNCKSCQAKKGFRGGCHSYWVQKLIAENADAACAISGERDHRFLELHHLLSRSLGGADSAENYVILSANYHLAFHNWMGGSAQPCRPEDFHEFCRLEGAGQRPGSRRPLELFVA